MKRKIKLDYHMQIAYANFAVESTGFPSTRRRLRVVQHVVKRINPLELACENLRQKAAQIQRCLSTANISAVGPIDRCNLQALDVKGLQCLLQGSVSPTVNVGVLAYAEAFAASEQKYGAEGIEKLKTAFRIFMAQLERALDVNQLILGADRSEYQTMLSNSFQAMLERLSTFFDGENVSFFVEQNIFGDAMFVNKKTLLFAVFAAQWRLANVAERDRRVC